MAKPRLVRAVDALARSDRLFALSVASLAISALTKAVVAICVVFVPTVAVGAAGVPVRVGDARLALRLSAVCCAVETGLLASDVLSTLPRPTSPLTRVTSPVLLATEVTISWLAAVMNTKDVPVRFNREPVELCVSVRLRVVPLAVYVPVPISQALPLSITYRTTSPLLTPAAENV